MGTIYGYVTANREQYELTITLDRGGKIPWMDKLAALRTDNPKVQPWEICAIYIWLCVYAKGHTINSIRYVLLSTQEVLIHTCDPNGTPRHYFVRPYYCKLLNSDDYLTHDDYSPQNDYVAITNDDNSADKIPGAN